MISLTTNLFTMWKRIVFVIAFIGAVLLGSSISYAAYIAPPSTVGEAVVLIDADTKEILFAKNPDKWMHPASTTKMVTLLTALELKGTQLDELATISSYATSMEESNLGVRVGDQITLEAVIEGMMVASGNDAAVVVAENVSGSVEKFGKDMTRIAAKAGAKNSVFLNPHGLTQMGHHSTARDLAMIAAYGMKYQMFRDKVANDYYKVPYQNRAPVTIRTTNHFIRNKYPGANGLKTGFTNAAGECLIASATRNGHTMIVVLLNDDNRWEEAVQFLDYGFKLRGVIQGTICNGGYMSSFFAFLKRMRFINRWSLMRNTETENIQEHSLEVAMVAHNLAALKNEYFGGNVDINKVAVIAMYHEVSEIFTGDMPTPIKYFDPKLRELYGEVESLAQEKMLSTLPERLQGVYKPFIVDAEESEEWPIVKAADTISAYMKCVNELKAGNDEFKEAHDSILVKLKALNMPEVDMFLETYMPALGKSLDELNYYEIK